MDTIATNTASNTEENVHPTSNNSTVNTTIVDNPEVGGVDTIFIQNTSDNTEIYVANSHDVNVEATENTSITSNNGPSARPKRAPKPTEKSIENRLQSDDIKLDKLWRNTTIAVTKLRETPDSVRQIKSHTSEVRSLLHEYRAVSLSLLEFLGGLSDPQYREKYETTQKLINDRSQFIQTVINDANERKNDLMLESNSSHRSRNSRN